MIATRISVPSGISKQAERRGGGGPAERGCRRRTPWSRRWFCRRAYRRRVIPIIRQIADFRVRGTAGLDDAAFPPAPPPQRIDAQRRTFETDVDRKQQRHRAAEGGVSRRLAERHKDKA